MGYVPGEFAALGSDPKQRLSHMEEGLDILELAWKEDRFDYRGKRYQLQDVRVHPRPVQEHGPVTWIAAMSEAGALRAARRATHLLPQGDRAAVLDPYLDALDRAQGGGRVGIVRHFLVTEDRALRAAFQGRSSVFQGDSYISKKYQEWFSQIDDAMTRQLAEGEARGRTIPQSLFAGDPDECIREIESFTSEFGITDIILAGWGTAAGDDPKQSTDNLERFAREILPHFA
jgi:alkanesulfonate monooxygenase SsuD/methylene tetrahydromethanopterin reductase-like flavin-dependent oxidoreductase (luciferase family)